MSLLAFVDAITPEELQEAEDFMDWDDWLSKHFVRFPKWKDRSCTDR